MEIKGEIKRDKNYSSCACTDSLEQNLVGP